MVWNLHTNPKIVKAWIHTLVWMRVNIKSNAVFVLFFPLRFELSALFHDLIPPFMIEIPCAHQTNRMYCTFVYTNKQTKKKETRCVCVRLFCTIYDIMPIYKQFCVHCTYSVSNSFIHGFTMHIDKVFVFLYYLLWLHLRLKTMIFYSSCSAFFRSYIVYDRFDLIMMW